jgi:general secretion pathway protein M
MDQLKALWANVEAWYASLAARERRMVLLASGAVIVFGLFVTVFSLSNAASATQRRTTEKLNKLQEVEELAQGYRESEAQRAQVQRQLSNNGIKLISYVNEKGTAAGLDIQTINPKPELPVGDGNILESAVEVTLTDINIRKLVDFLNSIEATGMVKVKNLRLEPRVSNETVTAWITVVTYKLKG